MNKIITFFLVFSLFITNSFSAEIPIDKNIFQDSIDKNFKPIDEKIETYLSNLNSDKDYCFWRNKVKDFIQCTNDIYKSFSRYWDYAVAYKQACKDSLTDTIKIQKNKTISTKEAEQLLAWSEWQLCSNLYLFKLFIFKSTAMDILKQNKYAINKDEHKLFTQKNRTKYDKLLDLIRINLGYIERLWKKWPSKTK